tara:strand:- start:66 stop:644 length:579 start_codon:yes stop_codon:yes gene_type:complete
MAGPARHPHLALRRFDGRGDKTNDKLFPHISSAHVIAHDGSIFKIKLLRARFEFSTDLFDATGEFTTNLDTSEANAIRDRKLVSLSRMKGTVVLAGHVPSANVIGIANLEQATGQSLDVKIVLGEGNDTITGTNDVHKLALAFRMVPQEIAIDWSTESGELGVTITGQTTEQFGGSGDPIQETASADAGNDT